MRTTLTIDDDVAAKLEDEMRRTGNSFKDTVNTVLRTGLNTRAALENREPFKVRTRQLGLHRGLSYDNIGDLLEESEGPGHR